MATAPCFPVMLTQQTATQRLVWGPAALWDGGQTQSHEETEGHKPCGAVWCGAVRCGACVRSPAMALLLSCVCPGHLAAVFATFSQQHCPPTNEVLISTNESTPANQSAARVTGALSTGSNSGTGWHRIHHTGPEGRGHFRRVPQIGRETKTPTHSYTCKYLVSGVQSSPQFTKRLLLLPVTDGPPTFHAGLGAHSPVPTTT